jgi:hypothetical protein
MRCSAWGVRQDWLMRVGVIPAVLLSPAAAVQLRRQLLIEGLTLRHQLIELDLIP